MRENIFISEFHHSWLSAASNPGGQPASQGPARLSSRPAFHCAGEGRQGRPGGLRPSLRQHRLAGIPLHTSLVRCICNPGDHDLDKLNIFVTQSWSTDNVIISSDELPERLTLPDVLATASSLQNIVSLSLLGKSITSLPPIKGWDWWCQVSGVTRWQDLAECPCFCARRTEPGVKRPRRRQTRVALPGMLASAQCHNLYISCRLHLLQRSNVNCERWKTCF